MFLVMIIGDFEVARKPYRRSDSLSQQIAELKKEFVDKIIEGKQPDFYLTNVPCSVNNLDKKMNNYLSP